MTGIEGVTTGPFEGVASPWRLEGATVASHSSAEPGGDQRAAAARGACVCVRECARVRVQALRSSLRTVAVAETPVGLVGRNPMPDSLESTSSAAAAPKRCTPSRSGAAQQRARAMILMVRTGQSLGRAG
ncbi:hypothetical protein L249_3669 [Ophiocordyceps polyrhachis-furcata BCC 54312]|uniref:Uncharacterized protein n=1 Tax=Ophiocordyceps polyrhachis-furcata BCC 54312 TaxID=1330021 RepID=A0A367L4N9_9HYPO|nr:hypothetical protein L249_3669 [Ophiocordyceps polyrhachis-furcata BCC 54312]